MGIYMSPSGTDIRRMLAKAHEAAAKEQRDWEEFLPAEADAFGRFSFAQGVEAALAWVLGERKEPPIA